MLLAFSLGVASDASGQQHPNLVRGFDPEKVYQLGDVDNVSLLNGNVIVTIPIGGEYPVGGEFSYSLTATYNAKVWDFKREAFFDPDLQRTRLATKAIPNRRSNAGLGWMVSVGVLLPPSAPTNDSGKWLYVDEGGAEHVFYSQLHTDNVPQEPIDGNTFYTRDGSYLRLKTSSTSVASELEFPDGARRTFDASNRVISISDRSGNALNVDYSTALQWKLTDRHGRLHIVQFTTGVFDGQSTQIVDYIDVRSFGGGTARYDFSYQMGAQPQRHCQSDREAYSDTVGAPTLSTISLPDGSSYGFEYYLDDAALPTSCRMGAIKSVRLPTRGQIEYEYSDWHLPVSGCPESADPEILESFDVYASNTPGVHFRTLRKANGTLEGRWTYEPALSAPPPRPPGWCPAFSIFNPGAEQLTVTVTSPLLDQTKHYFSVWPELFYTSANGFVRTEHGLPITHLQDDGANPKRLLSKQVLDCNAQGASCAVKRSEYARYERDGGTCGQQGDGKCTNANWRVASTKTIYNDDASRHATMDYSSFDGLGHFRQAASSGSFDSGNARTSITNFNPLNGTYPAAFTMVSKDVPWILDTYTEQSVTEGASTANVRFCFDVEAAPGTPSTWKGDLKLKRVQIGSSPNAHDVIVRYTRNPFSSVITEEWFGGDTQSVSTSPNLCALTLSSPSHAISNTYQAGVVATTQHAGSNFKDVENVIDPSTGLVKTSKDSAVVSTDFVYDSMNRLTWIKPAQDAWTNFVYSVATTQNPANVKTQRYPNGGSGALLTDEKVVFDDFGRLAVESRRMPGNVWSERSSKYDAAGNRVEVSTWGVQGAAPLGASKSLDFDAFGRPTTLRPPDGSAHDVTLGYAGDRQVTRTVKIATGADGAETNATTTETYDRQGRLYQVTEPSGSGGASVSTTYGYDVGGRLKSVASGSTPSQTRTFTYDNRGFLTSECHPEKGGVNGGGCVTYTNFDARGHAGRKTDGPSNLQFSYNAAEQLQSISEVGTGKALKVFTYGTSSAAADRSLGKVKSAERYNYVPLLGTPYTVKIKETYTYGGEQGRLSSKATENFTAPSANPLPSTPNESFLQDWTYDDLGMVDSEILPRCTHAGCTGSAAVAIQDFFPHSDGLLTARPGFVPSITYHPNGTLKSLTYFGGIVTTYSADPFGMERPSSIATSGVGGGQNWSTGTYAYDGAGNVKSIGTSTYKYDKVSRLVSATVFPGLTGNGTASTENYTYDSFGSLQAVGNLNTPTSANTNRLTGGSYDSAGNLTAWNGQKYEYDAFNQMTRFCSTTPCPGTSGQEWLYLYTAGDERIWSYKIGGAEWRWTLRNLDGLVESEFGPGILPFWRVEQYLYADRRLVASMMTQRQYHTDHLGTPRLISDFATNGLMAYHAYLPFGKEITSTTQDTQRLKFTAHERDFASLSGTDDDLDYMHARYFSPTTARFLSVDPALNLSAAMKRPQGWNRYAYVVGNPLRYTDPTGELPLSAMAEILSRYFDDGSGAPLARQFQNYIFSHNNPGMGPAPAAHPSDFIGPLRPGETYLPFNTRDLQRLGAVNEQFMRSLTGVFQSLQAQGWEPGVVSGTRSRAEQAEKVRLGFSMTMNSKHVIGQAADVVHRPTGYSLGLDDPFFQALGSAATAEGLVWGGSWTRFPDPSHVELP